jgi:AmiR/NasT family two-component response regulator
MSLDGHAPSLDGATPEAAQVATREHLLEIVRELTVRNEQLQGALDSRVLIEQAKGMLAERLTISPDDAFLMLRRAARANRIKLHDLAGRVVASRETPTEIAELAQGD